VAAAFITGIPALAFKEPNIIGARKPERDKKSYPCQIPCPMDIVDDLRIFFNKNLKQRNRRRIADIMHGLSELAFVFGEIEVEDNTYGRIEEKFKRKIRPCGI
jgi:hypothetical protein